MRDDFREFARTLDVAAGICGLLVSLIATICAIAVGVRSPGWLTAGFFGVIVGGYFACKGLRRRHFANDTK